MSEPDDKVTFFPPKGPEVLWAEKKLGRKLQVHHAGNRQYVSLTDAELDKLAAGPSPRRMMLFMFGGFAAAEIVVLLLKYVG